MTSQGQHSFCSLEITHLPPPSYSFCSLDGVGPLSGPKGLDGSVAWGPASSVPPPLEAALALCPFGLGLLALSGGGSLPFQGSAFLAAGTDLHWGVFKNMDAWAHPQGFSFDWFGKQLGHQDFFKLL